MKLSKGEVHSVLYNQIEHETITGVELKELENTGISKN